MVSLPSNNAILSFSESEQIWNLGANQLYAN